LYAHLGQRADAVMDLLDALASNTTARSVVELSLSPNFRRGHSSLYDAIASGLRARQGAAAGSLQERLRRVVASLLPSPSGPERPWLFSVDSLPMARPHALKLAERSWVHQAQPVSGRQPITIGHEYSLLMALPERQAQEPVWTLALDAQRLSGSASSAQVAGQQVAAILEDPSLPWHGQRCIVVADSRYSADSFLAPLVKHPSLVAITRLRSNRVLYQRPAPRLPGSLGRSRRYGAAFRLRQPSTWPSPAASVCLTRLSGRQTWQLSLQLWLDLQLVADGPGRPTHLVNLVRVVARRADGRSAFPRDLWLAVAGQARTELSLEQVDEAYRRRFDQEHGHRCLRRRLLFNAYQTPVVQHEETWVQLVLLAQAQLFAARQLASYQPRPWDPRPREAARPTMLGPTMVQRGLDRIFTQIGTPARSPKRRGNAPGRTTGQSPGRRPDQPVPQRRSKAA
jgi:hypothetical protein